MKVYKRSSGVHLSHDVHSTHGGADAHETHLHFWYCLVDVRYRWGYYCGNYSARGWGEKSARNVVLVTVQTGF